jgi:uncharacterized RDD family membrane protein YckC
MDMTARQWYYVVEGSQQGPVYEDELIQMIVAERITPDTLVWTQGMETWVMVASVAELMAATFSDGPPSLSNIPVPAGGKGYAGFWKRVAASIIDGIILEVAGLFGRFFVGAIAKFMMGMAGADIGIIQLVCSLLGFILGLMANWLYFTLMESSSKQSTLGKMALGIVVTDMDGRRISFGKANGRYWAKILSALIFCIGFMMAGFTEKKQGLHDIMAGTLVVNK